MMIDFHTHAFPDNIASSTIEKLANTAHIKAHSDGTVSGLKASSRKAGLDYSVVLPVATNLRQVSKINEISIEKSGKDGLIYFGCMHPDFPDYKNEIKKLAENGIKGIKIHPVYQDRNLDDTAYLRIFEECLKYDLIVLTHAGYDIGFPGAVKCTPQMAVSALKQVGPLKLIMAHMGGWKMWEDVGILSEEKSVYLDTAFSIGKIDPDESKSYYKGKDNDLLSRENFVDLVRAFGADRVVFGSDSPWTDQKTSVDEILSLPLTDDEKKAVLGGTAEKLLNLR